MRCPGQVSGEVPGHDQAEHCRGGEAAGAPLRQLGAVPGGAVLPPAHRHHGRVARAQVSEAPAVLKLSTKYSGNFHTIWQLEGTCTLILKLMIKFKMIQFF